MFLKNNNSIQIFRNEAFGAVRTMTDEKGEPWFVGKDVAAALGYVNPTKAVRDRVSEEDRMFVQLTDTQGGSKLDPPSAQKTNIVIINESGLYSLILSSKLESAKAFKRWVTSEVLPAIRRTGGYIPAKDLRTGERLSDTQIVRQAERILLQTIGGSNRMADGCVTSSDIAKSIGMNVKDFYRLLVKDGVIAWKGGRYTLTPRYDGMGLAQVRNFHYFALDGKKKERSYLVWTREGADFARQTAEMLNQSLFV